MHELSLISNLFEMLEEQAKEKNALRITRVKLQVGLLSGAVPELLKTAFDLYKKDTIAATAEIEIEEVPFRIRCRACSAEMTRDDFILQCESCGATDLETIAGTELILEKLEMEVD